MLRSLLLLLGVLYAVDLSAQTRVQYKLDPDANPWNTDASEVIAPDSTMTAGNTVCIGFTVPNSNRSVTSVVDAGSNTYSLATTCEVATAHEIWLYCSILTSNAANATVTISSAIASGGELFLWEFSGAHASDSVGGVACGSNGTPDTTHDSGTLTVQGASSVLIGATSGTSGAYTIDGAYTQESNTTTFVSGYRAVTANDEMNNTSSANETSVTALVEILPAAGGGGGEPPNGATLRGVGR